MRGFYYQLKLTAKDKMSIISFILPLIMAVAVNFLSQSDLTGIDDYRFAVLENESESTTEWLSQHGIVTSYSTLDALETTIKAPEDDTIGILANNGAYEIILSGDERLDTVTFANMLPEMINTKIRKYEQTVIPQTNLIDEFKNLFIGLVLVTALFLGLTFNTMNLVSEKEDGVSHINDILPLTRGQYLAQKIAIGFIGSVILVLLSAAICLVHLKEILLLIPLSLLCGFTVAIAGLFLGKISSSLMTALVYIKVAMIIFMAVPLLAYIYVPTGIKPLFHLLPSYTFFDGVMKILGNESGIWVNMIILIFHGIVWFGIYWVGQNRKISPNVVMNRQ